MVNACTSSLVVSAELLDEIGPCLQCALEVGIGLYQHFHQLSSLDTLGNGLMHWKWCSLGC